MCIAKHFVVCLRRGIIGDFLDEHLPFTTMIYVVALAAPVFKVEVEAWACKEIIKFLLINNN